MNNRRLNISKMNDIREYAERLEYLKALQLIEEMDIETSMNIQFLKLCGEVYIENKRFHDAEIILMQALQMAPRAERLLYTIVDMYIQWNKYDKAHEYFEKFQILTMDEVSKQEFIYKMAVGENKGIEEIIKPLEIIKKESYILKWAYILAEVYYQEKMYEKALLECDKIMKLFYEGEEIKKVQALKEKIINEHGGIDYQMYSKTEETEETEDKKEISEISNQHSNIDNELNENNDLKSINDIKEISEFKIQISNIRETKKENAEIPKEKIEKSQQENIVNKKIMKKITKIFSKGKKANQIEIINSNIMQHDKEMEDTNDLAIIEENQEQEIITTTQVNLDNIVEKSKEQVASIIEKKIKEETELVNKEEIKEIENKIELSLKEENKIAFLEKLNKKKKMPFVLQILFNPFNHYEYIIDELTEIFFQICKKRQINEHQEKIRINSEQENFIIVGERKTGKTTMAIAIAKALGMIGICQGEKIQEVKAEMLNIDIIDDLFQTLNSGVLIISNAGKLGPENAQYLSMSMEEKNGGIYIILEDNEENINQILTTQKELADKFEYLIKMPNIENNYERTIKTDIQKENESISQYEITKEDIRTENEKNNQAEIDKEESKVVNEQQIEFLEKKIYKINKNFEKEEHYITTVKNSEKQAKNIERGEKAKEQIIEVNLNKILDAEKSTQNIYEKKINKTQQNMSNGKLIRLAKEHFKKENFYINQKTENYLHEYLNKKRREIGYIDKNELEKIIKQMINNQEMRNIKKLSNIVFTGNYLEEDLSEILEVDIK